jgi:A/G-specific adenine glycosylase
MDIVIALILDPKGNLLIARRPSHVDCGGLWEFPGGKREAGETRESALIREVAEECGVTIAVGPLMTTAVHHVGNQSRNLFFYGCTLLEGTPIPRSATDLRWVSLSALNTYPFPEANQPLIKRLAASGERPQWLAEGHKDSSA